MLQRFSLRLISLLLTTAGACIIALPVRAAQLSSWQFDADSNRLIFTTDGGVQPRAQLVTNPVRVVIDLPGTTMGRSGLTQVVGGGIREVRVGQFDAQTTRIVIELNPGYTLDPQQVMVRGASPTQWTVQLPSLERVETPASPAPISSTPAPTPASEASPITGAAAQIESVRQTSDGFFIRTRGEPSDIDVDRSRDRQEIRIELEDTVISPQLTPTEQELDHLGVTRLSFTQERTSPPQAEITLELAEPGTEWQATYSNLGGLVLVPLGRRSPRPPGPATEAGSVPTSSPPVSQTAVIQAVELPDNQTQLIIRADRSITYDSEWDGSRRAYQIEIPNARLADAVSGPELAANSPLLQVRLREEEGGVIIYVQPATGVEIDGVNQTSPSLLSLQLRRTSQGVPITPPGTTPAPVYNTGELPQINEGRLVVVIDPGHGGPDPGAIGINGIHETDIVLPIGQQVAAILQQQGVQAVLTRNAEVDLDLEPRVQIAERADADLFVSIHANSLSLSRPDVNGIESYYYSAQGLPLAQTIHNSLLQVPGTQNRGVRQARFYVIRNTSMPAVLIEVGFVTGQSDYELLSDATSRNQIAEAIARGILQYIQQNL